MARVKRGVAAKKRHKKVLKQAKGYYGNKSRSFRAANEQVLHSGQYAFRDRRAKKGEFRRLWIQRINAACRQNDMSYSRFIAGLERGRHRGRSQGARRHRRHRCGDVHGAGRAGQGRSLEAALWANHSPSPIRRSNGCGASWGAAVRVPTRRVRRRRSDADRRGDRRRLGRRGGVRRAGWRGGVVGGRVRAAPRSARARRVDRASAAEHRGRRMRRATSGSLDAGLRRRRRSPQRSRQPRHDPAVVGSGGRRCRRADARVASTRSTRRSIAHSRRCRCSTSRSSAPRSTRCAGRFAPGRHVVASRARNTGGRLVGPGGDRARQRGARPARRCRRRPLGHDRPPRTGREPQRGDGGDASGLHRRRAQGPSLTDNLVLLPIDSSRGWTRPMYLLGIEAHRCS